MKLAAAGGHSVGVIARVLLLRVSVAGVLLLRRGARVVAQVGRVQVLAARGRVARLEAANQQLSVMS